MKLTITLLFFILNTSLSAQWKDPENGPLLLLYNGLLLEDVLCLYQNNIKSIRFESHTDLIEYRCLVIIKLKKTHFISFRQKIIKIRLHFIDNSYKFNYNSPFLISKFELTKLLKSKLSLSYFYGFDKNEIIPPN